MNSNTNNSEKNNNLTAQDEEFFAQHPQPTLEQARAFQEQEQEEEDLLSVMSDVEVDEDYYENEGMYNCHEDCYCFRCIAQDPLSRSPQICFVPDGEELIGDVDLEDDRDIEEEDQYLYDLKRRDRYPNKSLKTYHEHDPIPMDISDDEYVEQDEDQCEEDDEEQDEDDEYLCRHGTNCANQVCYDCVQALKEENSDNDRICDHGIDRENEVCYDCIWYLEQEALHARKRPTQAAAATSNEEKQLEDQAWVINVIIDDNIPMDIDDVDDRPQLKYQRQTSCWEQNGEMIYNGNPDGSRLFGLEDKCVCDLEEDDLTDLPDLLTEDQYLAEEAQTAALAQDLEHDLFDDYRENLYELDYLLNVLNSGETLDRWQTAKVIQLRNAIAYYEARH